MFKPDNATSKNPSLPPAFRRDRIGRGAGSEGEIIKVIITVIVIKVILFAWSGFDSNAWNRWDAGVYQTIATSAYSQTDGMPEDAWAFLSHFPPLFPLLMKIVSLKVLPLHVAGILVSITAISVASVLLYKITYQQFKNHHTAWLSVLFLNLFPTSYFTGAPYSEALFLLFSIASFYFLFQNKHLLAGLSAAAAILTRSVGVIFIPLFAVYAIKQYLNSKNQKNLNWSLVIGNWSLLVSLPIAAAIIHMAINKFYYQDPFYFLTEEISFNATKYLIIPFKETATDMYELIRHWKFTDTTFMTWRGFNAAFTTLGLIVSLIGLKKIRWELSFFALGSILIFASLSWGISNARYTLAAFPIFIVLASLKNKVTQHTLLAVFTIFLLYFTHLFTTGPWAF